MKSLEDIGDYLSFDVIGAELVDLTINEYINFDGLFVGIIIDNISNENCQWNIEDLEIVDASGFAYNVEYIKDKLLPGGWYSNLEKIKTNRKYRFVGYVDSFHGELDLISYEGNVATPSEFIDSTGYPDHKEEIIEIDMSGTMIYELDDLPEVVESLENQPVY